MAAGREAAENAASPHDADVLRTLRTATAREHARVEEVLDLMSPDLDAPAPSPSSPGCTPFWRAAEAGLDEWADREPA